MKLLSRQLKNIKIATFKIKTILHITGTSVQIEYGHNLSAKVTVQHFVFITFHILYVFNLQ